MHTLKEILAEPQTMYDGGVVRMQDGGDTEDYPTDIEEEERRKSLDFIGEEEEEEQINILKEKQKDIKKAEGTEKLWGPEEREYIKKIRKGKIDDPDFLRTYKATQKGLGHYTKEEVESMGMEDPWLPAAIDRTTVSSRSFRKALQGKKVHPLVLLGGDPRRLVSSPALDKIGLAFYHPYSTRGTKTYDPGEDPISWDLEMNLRNVGVDKRTYDKMLTSFERPNRWDKGDVMVTPRSMSPHVHAFHEAAHRGFAIIKDKNNLATDRLTEEIIVRLLEYKYFRDPDNPEKYLQETRDWIRNNLDEDIDKILEIKYWKDNLNYFLQEAKKERESRGFPKDDRQDMYDGGMVQASAKPMYDGGLV